MLRFLDPRRGLCYASSWVTAPFAFPGTAEEAKALCAAVAKHCCCLPDSPRCGAHEMLLNKRVLDHLLFVRRTRGKFIVQEFTNA